jgi:hypothetical protein
VLLAVQEAPQVLQLHLFIHLLQESQLVLVQVELVVEAVLLI